MHIVGITIVVEIINSKCCIIEYFMVPTQSFNLNKVELVVAMVVFATKMCSNLIQFFLDLIKTRMNPNEFIIGVILDFF